MANGCHIGEHSFRLSLHSVTGNALAATSGAHRPGGTGMGERREGVPIYSSGQ